MSDEPITDAELAEWKALAEAATPGPWKRCPCGKCGSVFTADGEAYVHIEPSASVDPYTNKPKEDAAFIAASRAALPRLIAEVERLRAEVTRVSADRVDHQAARDEWRARNAWLIAEVERLRAEKAAPPEASEADMEHWRAERNALGLHAHQVQHVAAAEHQRADQLYNRLRLLLNDARGLILVTTEIILASESLPAAAEAQLIKAIEAANELGAWLAAQPDQIGPPN